LKEDVNIIFVRYDAKIWRLQNIYFRLVANIRVVGAIAARYEDPCPYEALRKRQNRYFKP
jgi:hypothetical protein